MHCKIFLFSVLSSLKNISVAKAMHRFFKEDKTKYTLILIEHFEIHLVLI